MPVARPFTKRPLEEFFARSTVLPLTVVSDGLGCFEVAASLGACHDRTVTGGGKASVELEQFRCANTFNLAEVQFRFNRRYDLRA